MKTIKIGKPWYFWAYDAGYQILHGVNHAPLRVSLCLYCLHCVIGVFLAPLALVLWGLVILCDFAYIGCMLSVGMRPCGWNIREPFDEKFVPYNGLKIGRFSLYPINLIAFLAVVGVFWYSVRYPFLIAALAVIMFLSSLVLLALFIIEEGKLLFLVLLWRRFGGWFLANKEKVCPVIEIVDEARGERELGGGD